MSGRYARFVESMEKIAMRVTRNAPRNGGENLPCAPLRVLARLRKNPTTLLTIQGGFAPSETPPNTGDVARGCVTPPTRLPALGVTTSIFMMIASAALADPCEAPLPRRGEFFSGPVRYVGDGDSLCVAGPAGLIEVRVADFYAPELHEPGGREAKAVLSRIAMGQRVTCHAGKRSYDRVVAVCVLSGLSLGDRMRRAGVKEGGRGR